VPALATDTERPVTLDRWPWWRVWSGLVVLAGGVVAMLAGWVWLLVWLYQTVRPLAHHWQLG
jgi:hypothetical protein